MEPRLAWLARVVKAKTQILFPKLEARKQYSLVEPKATQLSGAARSVGRVGGTTPGKAESRV